MNNENSKLSSSSEPTTNESTDDRLAAAPPAADGAGASAFAPKPTHANKKSKLIIVAAVLLALVAAVGLYVLVFASKDKTAKTSTTLVKETGDVVVGVNTDLSAPGTSAFGISTKHGVEFAAEEINAKGGIMGRKVKIVAYDDKGDAETAKKNTEKLIKEDKAHAIIGPTHTTNAVAWIDMAQDAETTVIIPTAPATALTQKFSQRPRNYIFRLSATDSMFAELIVAWGMGKSTNGKLAILAPDNPYGKQGLKDLTDVLGRWGKVPVITSSFTAGTNVATITKNLTDIKASGADTILMYTAPDDSAAIMNGLNAMKYSPAVVGSGANLSPVLPKGAGALAAKLAFPTGTLPDTNSETARLHQSLTSKNGSPTPVFAVAAGGYDSLYMLKAAIEQAGTTADRKAYRDALENISSFKGLVKDYKRPFTKTDHEAFSARDLFIVHWEGAKLVTHKDETAKLEIR